MKQRSVICIAAGALLCILHAGCSRALIKAPVSAANNRWEMVLADLRAGPDQYNTANGHWEPRSGRSFLRATVRMQNRLKTGQQFLLKKIILTAGGREHTAVYPGHGWSRIVAGEP